MKNELSFSEIEMTRSCAKDLTDRINSTSEDLAGMLKRAHDEKAWQALGYDSWPKYVAGEIKLCRQRVFQLLDHETIRADLSLSTTVDNSALIPNDLLPTSERVTRELKKAPPAERAEKYAKAVELSGGKTPTAKTVKAVVEQSEQPIKQADAKVIEGEVDTLDFSGGLATLSVSAIRKNTSPSHVQARLNELAVFVFLESCNLRLDHFEAFQKPMEDSLAKARAQVSSAQEAE